MKYFEQPEQSGRAVIVIVALGLLITLGAGAVFVALALIPETSERPSSLGAGASGPGISQPSRARAAT